MAAQSCMQWCVCRILALGHVAAFGFELYCFGAIYLLQMCNGGEDPGMLFTPLSCFFHVTWVFAVVSYVRTAFYDPGGLPDAWLAMSRDWSHKHVERSYPVRCRLDKVCEQWLPERAEYCSCCGMAVLRRDQHCYLAGNCIGFGNQKFALLCGLYSSASSVAFVYAALDEIFESRMAPHAFYILDHPGAPQSACKLFDTCTILACVLGVYWSVFFMIQLCLMSTNVTCVEAWRAKRCICCPCGSQDSRPFDLGGPLLNLEQVLGARSPLWLVPVSVRCPLSDGLSYTMFGGRNLEGNDIEVAAIGRETSDNAVGTLADEDEFLSEDDRDENSPLKL